MYNTLTITQWNQLSILVFRGTKKKKLTYRNVYIVTEVVLNMQQDV